jgi:O-antigen/teichoic acid export membrane protein
MRLRIGRFLPVGLAAVAPCTQAAGSMLLILVASRTMDLASVGLFGLLYGFFVLGSGLVSGFVGDSLTVLDRAARDIRGALQAWFLLLAGSVFVLLAVASYLAGSTSPAESVVLGLAGFAFISEEIVRRLLMIDLKFGRVTLVDLAMILGTGLTLLASAANGLHLIDFILSVLIGQATGALAGVLLLPRSERYVVPMGRSALRQVARFGVWRAAQQSLRPALLASIRFVVILFLGLAAAGELEIARVYAAPALLLVGGFSSFLFSSYARDSARPLHELVRRADRAVIALAAFTILGSVVALLLLPVAGPLLTGRMPDPTAVAGWLCLSLGIGASIPYGSLAAVRGRASTVFGVRLGETLLSLALAAAAVALSDSFVLAPLCAAIGSLTGAAFLRLFVLAPLQNTEYRAHPSSAPQRRRSETHV